MSKKNLDAKNRLRSRNVGFRVSPEEAAELNIRYKICGYQKKQDFILDSLFKQQVVAQGNPQMIVSTRKLLIQIREQLKDMPTTDDLEEIKVILERILEVVESFSHEEKEGKNVTKKETERSTT